MLVTVGTFLHSYEAHALRSRLLAEGVDAFVTDETRIGVEWPLAVALGGVKVQVMPEQVEAARAVCRNIEAGVYTAELEEMFGDLDGLKCPSCGAATIKSRKAYFDLTALVVVGLLTWAIWPVRPRVHVCAKCGHEWDEA